MNELVNENNRKKYHEYHKTRVHKAPNENIVRLVQWHFKTGKGKVLDYGAGDGNNMKYMLDEGYDVVGTEISSNAIKKIEKKLEDYPMLNWKAELIEPDDQRLPFDDNEFDFIMSNQTVYFITPKENTIKLLEEFKRVLKPGGKIIISMMSRFNQYCIRGEPLGDDIYRCDGWEVVILQTEKDVRDMFSMFKIDEIGYFDNYYFDMAGHHWVIIGENNK